MNLVIRVDDKQFEELAFNDFDLCIFEDTIWIQKIDKVITKEQKNEDEKKYGKIHHYEMNSHGKLRPVTELEVRTKMKAKGLNPDDPQDYPDYNPSSPENQKDREYFWLSPEFTF